MTKYERIEAKVMELREEFHVANAYLDKLLIAAKLEELYPNAVPPFSIVRQVSDRIIIWDSSNSSNPIATLSTKQARKYRLI